MSKRLLFGLCATAIFALCGCSEKAKTGKELEDQQGKAQNQADTEERDYQKTQKSKK